MNEDAPLLSVAGLEVSFASRGGSVGAVRGVSFEIGRGQIVAIVGESGSGKSVTARSLVGLAGEHATVRAGALSFDGTDLRGLSGARWRSLRGNRIGFVLQDALGSLDPLRHIGSEIAEPLREHRTVPPRSVPGEVLRLLGDVGVPDPGRRARQYTHELSGGLRQRALIASAIAARPDLLIADEPTTALDVTVQRHVLEVLRERTRDGTAMLLISHDLAVVSELADHVYVMKDGLFVEEGPTRRVLDAPSHPYTRALLAAVPVPGVRTLDRPKRPSEARTVLEAKELRKTFRLPGRGRLLAADGVSFTVRAGETLGVVGESGSGKTTVGRMLMGLLEPDAGVVEVEGRPWRTMRGSARRAARRRVQMIYQDPLSSLDPRYTALQILEEPLRVNRIPAVDRRSRVVELLGHVGLGTELLGRHARELSGGQRQRLAIARALAAEPDVIVCDEPVSALDVSVQAQVLEVLNRAQAMLGVAYVFISHHLGVIYQISDRVVVMNKGEIVESGDVEKVFNEPRHPYTKSLLAAVPHISSEAGAIQG